MTLEKITKLKKDELYGSLVEFGSDPYLVETEEQAGEVLGAINNGTVYQITDPGDYESARMKLDLTGHKSGTIYGGVCESSFTICFAEDWDF